MRISEESLRLLIRKKIGTKINEEEEKKALGGRLRKKIRQRQKDRSRGNPEKTDPKSKEATPEEIKRLDDEVRDEKAAEAADNPKVYAECQKDMLVVIELVDDISRRRQGFLSFGKIYRSAREAKANRGVLINFIKQGMETAKAGDYGDASNLFCAAATRAENPYGGEDSKPVDVDPRIAQILDKWCKKFGGTRKSTKGTGRGGKGSPGVRRIQQELPNCLDPRPNLTVDGVWTSNGPTEQAWVRWLQDRRNFILREYPNVTGDMISMGKWGPLADATGFKKTYGGMADFIKKVCFGKGGQGPKPPEPTPTKPGLQEEEMSNLEFHRLLNKTAGSPESRAGSGKEIDIENSLKDEGIPIDYLASRQEALNELGFEASSWQGGVDVGEQNRANYGKETVYTYDPGLFSTASFGVGIYLAYDPELKILACDAAGKDIAYKNVSLYKKPNGKYVIKSSTKSVEKDKAAATASKAKYDEIANEMYDDMFESLIRSYIKST
jgi:hypothetical protein